MIATSPSTGGTSSDVLRKRDAMRILLILNAAGKRIPAAAQSAAPANAIKVVKAEKRLQALDFWVRIRLVDLLLLQVVLPHLRCQPEVVQCGHRIVQHLTCAEEEPQHAEAPDVGVIAGHHFASQAHLFRALFSLMLEDQFQGKVVRVLPA